MITNTRTQKVGIVRQDFRVRQVSRSRSFKAGLAMAVVCILAGPAQANPFAERFSGSLFDPSAGQTTTIVRGPNGSARTVEEGNTLNRRDRMMPRRSTSRISGYLFDPSTGLTTTIIRGPNGSASTVEEGNTLHRH